MHTMSPASCKDQHVEPPPEPARCRILLVDDDERGRAAGWLQVMGCEVLAERCGRSGMARLDTETRRMPVHGVLLNIQLPHIEDTIMRELRRAYADIPVMVMADAGHLHRLRAAVVRGAREYLVMPLDGELFQTKCRRVFQGLPSPSTLDVEGT